MQQPSSLENRRRLAEAYAADNRPADALAELRKITEIAPRDPAAWFALGHAYNGVAQDAMATFNDRPEDLPWRQLLLADALAEDGRLTDAFALYRSTSGTDAGNGEHSRFNREDLRTDVASRLGHA